MTERMRCRHDNVGYCAPCEFERFRKRQQERECKANERFRQENFASATVEAFVRRVSELKKKGDS